MRRENLEAIKAVYDELEQEKLRRDHAFHRLEAWRDRLLDEGDSAVEAFIADYPDVDRQALRQLIRNAQREREKGKPPPSARKLFKLIRDTAGMEEPDLSGNWRRQVPRPLPPAWPMTAIAQQSWAPTGQSPTTGCRPRSARRS